MGRFRSAPTDLRQQQALRTKVLGAMLYPAIVSLMAFIIVIVLVLMTWFVPKIAGTFARPKRALPLLTVAMLAINAFVQQCGWAVAVLAVGGLVMFTLARRTDSFRERSDAAFLRLPLIGRFTRGYNAARFGSTLAMLAGAGVQILKALQAAANTLNNWAMRSNALEALAQVREGASLASTLAGKKRVPGLLSMYARLGEKTGQLPLMLQRASVKLSAEVQRRAVRAATILKPLLIVGMGIVAVLIVLAVLLPIIQLNT